ncbi:hypothetical protein P3T76_003076 [Phytophthora citrophthora]|uniref:PiggyBac transposable element-derived protein domain-containing protein n=1 Tax=Phytophthora citrophthora TaxID=4793 RepID=A0AAD9LQJ3_9STRA|nr:hypothetical protein P3T76_003076 [Phytophthora citrophthora]
MDIASLLNFDDEEADWDFEDSENECGQEAVDTEEDVDEVCDSEEDVTTPAGQRTGNAYVDNLIRDSGLHIVREREVTAFKERGELGLFSRFLLANFATPCFSGQTKC